MKNSILISALIVTFFSCKKEPISIDSNPVIAKTCSPLPLLEGQWKSDSIRFVTTLHGVVDNDTIMAYNTPKSFMNLNFYCDNNIATINGSTEADIIDPTKYSVFNNTIYIGNNGDTSQMDKAIIISLINNHLILKGSVSNSGDTLVVSSYLSLRK